MSINFNHKTGKFIDIDSSKIYYEELGNPQKQPLIFLHGGFGNIEDFNKIIPLLKKEYRIIGIDSRGHGMSTLGSEILSYERVEKDVKTIIEKLELLNPVLIGFSDGGIVALRLASFNNIEIDKMIIIGSSWHTKSLKNSKTLLESITAEKWKEKFPKTFNDYQILNPKPNFSDLTRAIVNMWIDEGITGHPDDNVQNINCPTLIVRVDKDHLVSIQSVVELTENIEASCLANIPFSGHEVYVDQKSILMKMINQFLD